MFYIKLKLKNSTFDDKLRMFSYFSIKKGCGKIKSLLWPFASSEAQHQYNVVGAPCDLPNQGDYKEHSQNIIS